MQFYACSHLYLISFIFHLNWIILIALLCAKTNGLCLVHIYILSFHFLQLVNKPVNISLNATIFIWTCQMQLLNQIRLSRWGNFNGNYYGTVAGMLANICLMRFRLFAATEKKTNSQYRFAREKNEADLYELKFFVFFCRQPVPFPFNQHS